MKIIILQIRELFARSLIRNRTLYIWCIHISIDNCESTENGTFLSIELQAYGCSGYEYIRDLFSRIFSYEWTSNRKYNNHIFNAVSIFEKMFSSRTTLNRFIPLVKRRKKKKRFIYQFFFYLFVYTYIYIYIYIDIHRGSNRETIYKWK